MDRRAAGRTAAARSRAGARPRARRGLDQWPPRESEPEDEPVNTQPDGQTATERRTVIDAHVHFWHPGQLNYPWLSDAPALNGPRTAEDLSAVLPEPVEVIFVEA